MSKNSNNQRYDQLQEWDRWMMNEYPSYKDRKKKSKSKKPGYFKPEEEDLQDYHDRKKS
tara:strand:- start:922 stop:1098 length:177 start_codon:yes stop_codon:yes gene_type:complete